MISLGIDYSMSCPAITVMDTENPQFMMCKSYYLINTKKYDIEVQNITGTFIQKPSDFDCQEQRYDHISSWAMDIILAHKPDIVILEGYALGSKKGAVFNIAENTGLLKHKIWETGDYELLTPTPTQIKMFFAGKGNANKESMYDAFFEQEQIDISALLGATKTISPVNDIVDSFAMAKYGKHYLEGTL